MCSTYFDCPMYHELCQTYSMKNPDLLRSPAPGGGHFFTPGHGSTSHLTPGGGSGSPQSSPGPSGAPPTTIPSKAQATSMKKSEAMPGGMHMYALTIGSIQPCLNRLVYLWLNNGYQAWAWLVYGNVQAIWGYYWNGFTWDYFGIDLNSVDSFYCA